MDFPGHHFFYLSVGKISHLRPFQNHWVYSAKFQIGSSCRGWVNLNVFDLNPAVWQGGGAMILNKLDFARCCRPLVSCSQFTLFSRLLYFFFFKQYYCVSLSIIYCVRWKIIQTWVAWKLLVCIEFLCFHTFDSFYISIYTRYILMAYPLT